MTVSEGQSADDEFELTCSYTLFPGKNRIDRSAKLVRNASYNNTSLSDRHMEVFRFILPGIVLGEPSECLVNVPGPWFPNTYVKPETPYPELKDRSIGFHNAPDGGFGVLAVTNKERNITLASWLDTGGEVNYRPSLRGDGERISFIFDDYRAYRLFGRLAISSDTQRIELVKGSLPIALDKYRQMCEETMPLEQHTPEAIGRQGKIIRMRDAITGETIETSGEALELKLKPFQVLVGRF